MPPLLPYHERWQDALTLQNLPHADGFFLFYFGELIGEA